MRVRGFNADSPRDLDVAINNFLFIESKLSEFIDVKYSTTPLRNDQINYSALIMYKEFEKCPNGECDGEISKDKIKLITKTIIDSDLYVVVSKVNFGNYDLKLRDYEEFIKAIMSDSPEIELKKIVRNYTNPI